MGKNTLTALLAFIMLLPLSTIAEKPVRLDDSGGPSYKPGQQNNTDNRGKKVKLIANDDVATTTTSTSIVLHPLENDTIIDDPSLIINLSGTPLNGSVEIRSDNSIYYTPSTGYIGSDEFTYIISTSSSSSNIATIYITIEKVSLFQAKDDNAVTTADMPISIDVTSNDLIDDPTGLLTSLESQPINGSAIVQEDSSVLYAPAKNFIGTDSFRYSINSPQGLSDVATVFLSVEEPNLCSYLIHLSWDVSVAEDIVGYYIYMGTSPQQLVEKTFVGKVFDHEYCVSSPGQYYFAASSENSSGVESILTPEVIADVVYN